MAFSSTFDGQTAGTGGTKRLYGTFNAAAVTTGTITWKGSLDQVYNLIGGGVVQSTTITTAGSTAGCKITAGTLVVDCEAGAQGYWWVEVK